MIKKTFVFIFCFVFQFKVMNVYADLAGPIALHGEAKYSYDFKHFDYVSPNASKGGSIRLAALGGFDNFSPYPNHKTSGEGIYLTFDSLLKRSLDEPFACYPRIAQEIELGDDDSWVTFKLNPAAQFHDKTPILARDVFKTIEVIQKSGPFTFREAFQDIARMEILADRVIKFSFKKENQRALALLIGVLPIMSAKDLDQLDLNSFGFKNVLANGPYKIKQYASNKFIEYERVKDYWGEDLPCQKNHHNFDIIRFEYFRNYDAAFEAFKAGEIDLFQEEDIGHWLKNYNFPATKKGDVQLREIPHQRPCVFGFVFNTRRLLFQNKLVRKALSLALDLDHLNKNYFHNAYEVIDSFFGNSDLSALLEKQIKPYEARQNLSDASALLKQAGFKINRNQLSDLKTGKPFVFEILLQNPLYERIALTFKNNLEKLGIVAHISLVNSALYQKRLNDFDYDMIIHQWQQSLAPDREQLRYWGSKAAQIAGSANYAGISDPEIDVLLEKLLIQKNREGIIKITHALDRALQSGYYVIPLLQKTRDFIAYWNKFGHPKSQPVSAFPLLKWWCVQTWWQNDMSHSFE